MLQRTQIRVVAKPQQINGSFGRLSARYRPWKTIPDVAESGRGSVYWAMRLTEVTSVLLILAAACGHEVPVHSGKKPPVAVAAQATLVHALDSVTFIARIRSEIAGELRRVDHPGDPAEGVPHIVGWQWSPTLARSIRGRRRVHRASSDVRSWSMARARWSSVCALRAKCARTGSTSRLVAFPTSTRLIRCRACGQTRLRQRFVPRCRAGLDAQRRK